MKTSSAACLTHINATPFLVSVQDSLLLDRSEGFAILRKHLKDTIAYEFCEHHSSNPQEDLKPWTIVRDLLHALLAPIVALQDHASNIAAEYLKTSRPEDFEFAYAGNARNAFVWLQSFLSTETSWCLSQGCPACIVTQALDSEESIRLILSSCMLSAIQNDKDFGRPTLPSLEFFIRSMRDAMEDDDLWGTEYFDIVEPRSHDLQEAMQELMYQCQTIEFSMSPPSSPNYAAPFEQQLSYFHKTSRGMPIRRSDFAKKQKKMLREEALWLRTVVKNCWDTIDPEVYAEPITTEFVRRLSVISLDS